jgi:thiamine-phosphate pyrophosphorylase
MTPLRAGRPLRYWITDRAQLGTRPLLEVARRVLDAGIDFVQVREKDLGDRAAYELAARMVRVAARTGARVLVNGRLDIALAAGAAGVHLPSNGLSARVVRGHAPEGFLIGVSTHSIAEGMRAARERADYVLLGPIFPTPSKLRYGPALGLRYLTRACRRIPIPVLALGGISEADASEVVRAGAAGIAAIRLFQKT